MPEQKLFRLRKRKWIEVGMDVKEGMLQVPRMAKRGAIRDEYGSGCGGVEANDAGR